MCGMCVCLAQLYLLLLYKVFVTLAQLHVSAIDVGHLQAVHEQLTSNYTNKIWVVFRGREGLCRCEISFLSEKGLWFGLL